MIETERLTLRPFAERDRAAIRAFWTDPATTAHLGGVQDAAWADAMVARYDGYHEADSGFGLWTVERRGDGAFLGLSGFKPGAEDTPIAGEFEIFWGLRSFAWGQGYAAEAARASLAWGWAHRDAPRIVAITPRHNAASRALAERIGMRFVGDFRHPKNADDEALSDGVIYAIDRPA